MKNIKYKIGSDLFALFPILVTLLIFGSISIWLYISENGIFIFTGLISLFIFAILLYTLYSFFFVKILIYEDGLYYQKGISGKKYDYSDIEEIWVSTGKNTNGSLSNYLNLKLIDGSVLKFVYKDFHEDAVDYLKEKINV